MYFLFFYKYISNLKKLLYRIVYSQELVLFNIHFIIVTFCGEGLRKLLICSQINMWSTHLRNRPPEDSIFHKSNNDMMKSEVLHCYQSYLSKFTSLQYLVYWGGIYKE